jgi:hypothetical protein
MDPALTTTLIALTAAALTGFVAYWAGVGNAEKRHKAREAALLDDLDDAIHVLTDMAVNRHPAGRHLRLVSTEGA